MISVAAQTLMDESLGEVEIVSIFDKSNTKRVWNARICAQFRRPLSRVTMRLPNLKQAASKCGILEDVNESFRHMPERLPKGAAAEPRTRGKLACCCGRRLQPQDGPRERPQHAASPRR